ncbi:MAG TPA: hypothetical protein VMS17_21320 [Gemmataceae bacterium]|nr:hypothetical protein [Gemmataceae bacterium]
MTPPSRPPAAWKQHLLLGVLLFLVYIANGRSLFSGDTIPASQLPTLLLHGHGVFLDRYYNYAPPFHEIFAHGEVMDGVRLERYYVFDPRTVGAGTLGLLASPAGPAPLTAAAALNPNQVEELPYYVSFKHGHIVSRYPLAPPLLALPLEAPQVFALDLFAPGWDRDPAEALAFELGIAKITAACIGALTGVTLFALLRGLGLGWLSWPAVLAAALGSELWCVGSEAMWQHGPAALFLTLAMLLLLPEQPSRRRLCLAGLATALLVCCRALDVVYAAAIVLGVLWCWPRKAIWFLPFPLVLGGLLLAYNIWLFGTPSGGQDELEAYNPLFRQVAGVWTGNVWDGATGSLFSPNRGLFVFSPWALLALLALPFTWGRLRKKPVLLLLIGAFAVNVAMLAKYSSWWGGCCFGPRFLTDATPVLAVPLGLALMWAWPRRRVFFGCFGAAIVLSILIQAIGAFLYPSRYNIDPDYIDHQDQRHRLWDWTDGELGQCLHVREWRPHW